MPLEAGSDLDASEREHLLDELEMPGLELELEPALLEPETELAPPESAPEHEPEPALEPGLELHQ